MVLWQAFYEVWLSLVEHYVRDVGAASSNLVTSTSGKNLSIDRILGFFFCCVMGGCHSVLRSFDFGMTVFAKICHFNFVSEKYRLEITKNINNE